jgi:uncharacterized protein YjbJ (UPF0337 family)
MNTVTLKGSWNVIKGELKRRYRHLTDHDLAYIEGFEDELIDHIQHKVGCTRRAFFRFIEESCGG